MKVGHGKKGTNTGGRSGRASKAFTAPTLHEAGRAISVGELNVLQNVRCYVVSAAQRKECAEWQSKSAEAERQRQEATAYAVTAYAWLSQAT